jgi:TRAP transporter TAXI family solute receptor
MHTRFRFILLALLFAFCGAGVYAAHNDGAVIGMVTGSKTGTYIAFGRDIAREAARAGIKVNVYDSKGSIDNINRITSKEKVGLAIVQSDVLGFLSRSKNKESINIANKIRLVAPFYNEEVHILANRSINSIEDLAGKRVVAGGDGSGSVITAENIFSIVGVSPSKLYEADPAHGVIALLDNEVDAFVFVGGKPVKLFKNMEDMEKITDGPNAGKLQNVHFLPLNDPRLLKEYKPATFTHKDYNYVTQDTPTIAVTALLVTYDYTMKNTPYYRDHCRTMRKLVEALYDNMGDLRADGHPKWREVDLNADIGNWKRDACSQKVATTAQPSEVPPTNDNGSLEKDLLGVVRGK